MSVIQFQQVSKIFHRHTGRKLIRHHLRDWFQRDPEHDFYALKDISFEVAEGENVAIVGRNGAGKSTLLSLVCGLATPEKGRIEVNGKIAALMELGSGFHYDLTGASKTSISTRRCSDSHAPEPKRCSIRSWISPAWRSSSMSRSALIPRG